MLNVVKLKLVASVFIYAKCHDKVIKKLDAAIITALKLSICVKNNQQNGFVRYQKSNNLLNY